LRQQNPEQGNNVFDRVNRQNQHNADTHRDQQHQGQMGQDQQYDRNTAPQNLGTSLIPSLSK
jgi:hypothetical protein